MWRKLERDGWNIEDGCWEYIDNDRTRWLCVHRDGAWRVTHQDIVVWERLDSDLPPYLEIEGHHKNPVYRRHTFYDLSKLPVRPVVTYRFPDGREVPAQ